MVANLYGSPTWTDTSPIPDLSLVDRMFLVGHDTTRGTPLVGLDVLGIGLIGAALIELLRGQCIGLKYNGQVFRTAEHGHNDDAAQYVLGCVLSFEDQQRRDPRLEDKTAAEWISELRDHLYVGVATTLIRRGIVAEQKSGIRPGSRGSRFIPSQREQKDAAEEANAWCYRLFRSPHLAGQAGVLPVQFACLVGAMGIGASLTALPPSEVTAGIPQLLNECEIQSALVVREVHSATSKLAMTPRR